jgi:hypothetical protein
LQAAVRVGPVALLVLWGAAALADPFVLTFDDVPGIEHGTVVGSQYGLEAGGIRNRSGRPTGVGVNIVGGRSGRGNNWAVAYDTDPGAAPDSNLTAGFTSLNPQLPDEVHPGNILILNENAAGCASARPRSGDVCADPDDEAAQGDTRATGWFKFDFSEAVTLTGFDFFDIRVGDLSARERPQLQFFGEGIGGLVQIGSPLYLPDTGGANTWDRLTFNVTGVRRLVVKLAGSGGIDNLTGLTERIGEPATVTLMLAAVLGLVAGRRGRPRPVRA